MAALFSDPGLCPGRRHWSLVRLVSVPLCLALLATLPGCSGCRKTPEQIQAEREKGEAERREKERQRRKEKKPDLEMGKLVSLPHEWGSAVFSEARSHIARRTSCSGMPAAAATWIKTSGETEGASSGARSHRRAFNSAARRRIISTSAGLRRLSVSSAIRGVILQVLEPLIALRSDRENPRRVPQIGPPGEQRQDHRDGHRPPAQSGDRAAPAVGVRHPE